MNAALGSGGVLLAFLAAVLGALTVAVGLARRPRLLALGRNYVWLLLGGAIIAVAAMERGLVTRDFTMQYVADNGSRATPLLYTVASLWGALEGSILLWGLVLAGYLAAMAVRFRSRRTEPMFGWALLTGFIVAAFFFGLMLGPANPFESVAGGIVRDGPGPNPLLQNHPLMAVHPPILYLGYVGFTVPFGFAIAALATGQVGESWLAETRRWTLFAWGFLTMGILLGGWWSYEVLGWGGYWAWDPVENASFLPWLTGTAYVHSVMVQERRGLLRVWNLSLLVATFCLTILGTFLTRSGVLDSVHSFTESPIGPAILTFFGATVAVVLVLIAWRGDALRTSGVIESPVSREGAFLANNLLFAAFAFVVLLGTVFPLVLEAVNGDRISVGRPYFDRMTMPIGLALLFLMAVAPALPWRRADANLLQARLRLPAAVGSFTIVACVALGARGWAPLLAFGLGAFAASAAVAQIVAAARGARRQGEGMWRAVVGSRGGGMVVHIGVVVVAVAFAASSSYDHRTEVKLRPGQSATVAGHRITYRGVEDVKYRNRTAVEARVAINGGREYRPALTLFPFATQAIGTPSVRTSVTEDVYLTLVRAPAAPGGAATIGVIIHPLVAWLWVGGGIMAVGTLLAAIPAGRRRFRRRRSVREGGETPVADTAREAATPANDLSPVAGR